MPLQTNKDDFEVALNNLELYISDLEQVVSEDIAKALNGVISEYQTHLQGDIELMMEKIDILIDQVEELQIELNEAREYLD